MRVSPILISASLLFGLPCTTSAFSGAAEAPRQVPAAASPAAADGLSSYRNDVLHLSYRYPSSYTDASAIVGPAFQASLSNDPTATALASKCITLPFSRSNLGNGQVAFVLLIRADAGCLKKKFDAASLPEFTQGEATGLTSSGAKTDFGKPVSFQTGGHPATMLKGSFVLPTGQALNAMIVCVLTQPDVACWQFLSGAPETLSTMAAFPVTFDGAPATPLVPASVLVKP